MLNGQFINQAVTTFIELNTDLKEVIVTSINEKHAIFQAETKEAGVKIFRLREYSEEYQISIEGGHKWDHYKLIDKWEHSRRVYK